MNSVHIKDEQEPLKIAQFTKYMTERTNEIDDICQVIILS